MDKRKYILKHIPYWLFAIAYSLFFCNAAYSQEVKKSKKVQTIEGKKYYIHIVGKGQTLYAIAHAYELKVNDIVIENPNSIDGIKPGQSLRIPLPKEKGKNELLSKTDSARYYFHLVQQGETMYSLSKFYVIGIDKINKLNPELKEGLKVGQVIKMPADRAKANGKNSSTGDDSEIKKEESSAGTKPIQKSDASKKMNSFNIALFLPFHVGETNEPDADKMKEEPELPEKSEVAIQFYEGVQMAVDSLKKNGLIAKIYVYDMNENDSIQFQAILKKPELQTMDLMIGPLYSSNFVPFAKYAKENQLFITSPLSQQNKILFNNPYVSKVTASLATQTEQMAEYIAGKYKNENIIVVNSGNSKDALLVKTFMNKANEILGKTFADSINEVNGFGGIGNFVHPSKLNVVVVPSNNKTFVTDFITKLNPLHEKKSIILFGLDSWTNFDNLDLDYLNNMQLHYPSPVFIDYENVQVKEFIHEFLSRYKTDPGIFAFQGFDVAFFYVNMLRNYGLNFQNKLATAKQSGLQTAFDFYQVSPESGFENKAVFMLMYRDYKLVKAN